MYWSWLHHFTSFSHCIEVLNLLDDPILRPWRCGPLASNVNNLSVIVTPLDPRFWLWPSWMWNGKGYSLEYCLKRGFYSISRHDWESLLEVDCGSLIVAKHTTDFSTTSILAICKGMSLQYERIHLVRLLRLCGQISIVSIKEYFLSDWGGESPSVILFLPFSYTGQVKGLHQRIIISEGGKKGWEKAWAYMWHNIIQIYYIVLWDWQYFIKYFSYSI